MKGRTGCRTLVRVGLAVALLVAGTAPVEAQRPYATWLEMLEANIDAADRGVPPREVTHIYCTDPILPDSLALTTAPERIAIGQLGPSRYDPYIPDVPTGPDTLRVALVEIECDMTGDYPHDSDDLNVDLIVERDGYYFRISGYNIASERERARWESLNGPWDSFVRIATPGGGTDRLVLEPRCNMSQPRPCRPRLSGAQARAAAQRNAAAAREARIRGLGWPARFTEAAVAGRVLIGMSTTMVIGAWGRPREINTTTTASGVSEQWVYANSYVYFEDGRVTTIQTRRPLTPTG